MVPSFSLLRVSFACTQVHSCWYLSCSQGCGQKSSRQPRALGSGTGAHPQAALAVSTAGQCRWHGGLALCPWQIHSSRLAPASWALRSHQIAHRPSPESFPEEETRPQRAVEVAHASRISLSFVSLHPRCQKLRIARLLQDSCPGSCLFVQMIRCH